MSRLHHFGRLAGPAVLLIGFAACVAAQDVRYSETHLFTVAGDEVTEDVDVAIEFVSERSTSQTVFGVHEQYFNPVTDFHADLDGRAVRSRQFVREPSTPADVFLSGGTVTSFSLEAPPRVGQRLAYRYRRTYADAAFLPVLYVPNADRLERYEVVVRHPADVAAAFDVAVPRGTVRPEVTTSATESRVVFASLDEAPDVPLFALNDVHAAVQIDLRRGDGALTPTRPDEFAAWYGRLLGPRSAEPSPALRGVAETLRRASPEATVAAIHDHVRGRIRYIADARAEGAFVPRAPDVVLDRSYGDCKDRASLVAALAGALGLRVDLVLAATEPSASTAGVSLGLYNHVICAFGEGAARVYFDPTHPYLPYGDLPEGDVDGRMLRLGAGGAEDLRLAAQDSLPALDVAVRFGLDDAAGGRATVVARGQVLGAIREMLARGSGADPANVLSAIAGEWLYRIRLSRLVLVGDTADALTFEGRADLSQFVVASPTRRYLPQTPFQAVPAEARARRADALPLDLPQRPNVRLRLLVAPGAWTAEPAAVAWGGPLARFEARVAPGPDGTELTYAFRQLTRHFAGDDRTAYLDLADRYLSARRDVFTFTSTSE